MPSSTRHTIEVFSAGCSVCDEATKVVREIAGASHELKVHDLRTDHAAQTRAKQLGIHRVPAVVVNGHVAQCCHQTPVDASVIRSLIASTA